MLTAYLDALVKAIENGYYPNGYEDLTEEEKSLLKYVDKCLYEENEKISDACSHYMLLILELASKIDTDEELTTEEVNIRKEKILDGFNQNDREKIEFFGYACINTMGIYSEERIQERKLRKKGNDNNDKNK